MYRIYYFVSKKPASMPIIHVYNKGSLYTIFSESYVPYLLQRCSPTAHDSLALSGHIQKESLQGWAEGKLHCGSIHNQSIWVVSIIVDAVVASSSTDSSMQQPHLVGVDGENVGVQSFLGLLVLLVSKSTLNLQQLSPALILNRKHNYELSFLK